MEWDISWRRERRREGELMIGWKYVLGFIMREEQKRCPTRILGQWWLQAVQNKPRPTWSLFWIQISTRKGFLSSSTCASWSRCHFCVHAFRRFMQKNDRHTTLFKCWDSERCESLTAKGKHCTSKINKLQLKPRTPMTHPCVCQH